MAAYYGQRASAGLIVAEATDIAPSSNGYAVTPGIYTPAQQQGWRLVTDEVHRNGGTIFLQLWHVGRMAHPSLMPNSEAPWGVTEEGRTRRCLPTARMASWPISRQASPGA
ncbi:hypothetical protein [Pseudomonas sp. 31-12]|uniref:oxidoreductase n=1 Tax=Pseudomonas sp. 31-12 TaxID=2201356 RepID=UPI003531D141